MTWFVVVPRPIPDHDEHAMDADGALVEAKSQDEAGYIFEDEFGENPLYADAHWGGPDFTTKYRIYSDEDRDEVLRRALGEEVETGGIGVTKLVVPEAAEVVEL